MQIDWRQLLQERDQAQAALRRLIPFVEYAWQGTSGCLMPNCVLETGHTKECPIGIGRAALAEEGENA